MELSEREEQIIIMIMRQTDYDRETTIEKLKKWNNNYLNVMKEYMNPTFSQERKIEENVSTNQTVMKEIRGFMDNVQKGYQQRKKYQEYMEKKRQQQISMYKKIVDEKVTKAKDLWKNAPDDCWKNVELVQILLRDNTNNFDELKGQTFSNYTFA
jgi:glutamate synthase domain-containing protein 2